LRSKSKRKQKTKPKRISKNPIKAETEVNADNVIRLKITVRKGARIESVPLKKLEKIATKKQKQWELKGEWIILNANG
jgi:hypothetical protein